MSSWKKLLENIPTHLKVSNKGIYEIVWVDGFKDPSVVGETRFNPKQIAIKTKQSPRETMHTLYHEYQHAVSHEYKVDLTEKQVKALEKSLYFNIMFVNMLNNGNNKVRRNRVKKK